MTDRPEPKFKVGDRLLLAHGKIAKVRAIVWDECWNEWTYDLGGICMPCECYLEERARLAEPEAAS